ncbi:hypothetical protein ACFLZW_02270 [Chloroflexota bacterium]
MQSPCLNCHEYAEDCCQCPVEYAINDPQPDPRPANWLVFLAAFIALLLAVFVVYFFFDFEQSLDAAILPQAVITTAAAKVPAVLTAAAGAIPIQSQPTKPAPVQPTPQFIRQQPVFTSPPLPTPFPTHLPTATAGVKDPGANGEQPAKPK